MISRREHLEMETEGWLSPAQGGAEYVETNCVDYRVDLTQGIAAARLADGFIELGRILSDAAAEPRVSRTASSAAAAAELPIPRLMKRQAD